MKRLVRKAEVIDFESAQRVKQTIEKLEKYMSVLSSNSVVNTHEFINPERLTENTNDYQFCQSLVNRLKQKDLTAIDEANQIIDETAKNLVQQLRGIVIEYEQIKGKPGRENVEDDIEYFNETIQKIESGDIEAFKEAFEIIA